MDRQRRKGSNNFITHQCAEEDFSQNFLSGVPKMFHLAGKGPISRQVEQKMRHLTGSHSSNGQLSQSVRCISTNIFIYLQKEEGVKEKGEDCSPPRMFSQRNNPYCDLLQICDAKMNIFFESAI